MLEIDNNGVCTNEDGVTIQLLTFKQLRQLPPKKLVHTTWGGTKLIPVCWDSISHHRWNELARLDLPYTCYGVAIVPEGMEDEETI